MRVAGGRCRVNVLALQWMLGHKSAKMALDTYADLFDDDLDAVGATLHARYAREVTVTPGPYSKLWAKCGHGLVTELANYN